MVQSSRGISDRLEQQTLSRCSCWPMICWPANSSRRAWRQAGGSLHGLKRSMLPQTACHGGPTHLMLPVLHPGCARNRARDLGWPHPIAPSAPLTGYALGQQGNSRLQTVAGTLHMHEHFFIIRILIATAETCSHIEMSRTSQC